MTLKETIKEEEEMEFDYFNTKRFCYITNHPVNQHVSKSLCIGFSAQPVYSQRVYHRGFKQLIDTFPLYKGLSICYGILRGCGQVIQETAKEGLPFLYVDHSFFGQCRTNINEYPYEGYFRCVKDDRYTHETKNYPTDRFEKLKLNVKPWRENGDHIVVTPLSRYVGAFSGIDPDKWLQETMEILSRHTKRPLVVKPKDSDAPLAEVLRNAWALVTMDSNSAVDAAIEGIPVFCSPSAAAAPVGNMSFVDIEDPKMPERTQWLANLAYQQFTLEEIENGFAAKILYKDVQ